jgi:uncharacterized cupredoxin-like copper-binding protein
MKRGTALATVVALVASAALAGSQAGAATSVRVTMTEFEFALAKSSVPKGAVTFKLVNRGDVRHDMRIGGKKSANIRPGGSGTLKVTLSRAGRYPYVCTLPGHAEAGMRGTLTVR